MNSHYQLLIIGAGAAGLSAAITASEYDISCAVLDEQAHLGGQIYRSIEVIPKQRAEKLGAEYNRGNDLAKRFHQSTAEYYPNTKVFSLNKQREIGLIHQDKSRIITADIVIVASGAMERPVPFKGWTLAGVMQAGAGQILYKSAGVIPDNGVVLAGSGPLLLLLAWQYLHAGVEVKALLDTTPLINNITALPQLPKALLAHRYLTKGISYQIELKKAGIPLLFNVSDLQAEGKERLERVHFKHWGKSKTIESELLLTHFGVIPHIWLTQAAGCQHDWDDNQQCWRPQHDIWGQTSLEGILVAGDGAGIHGARSAEQEGCLVAWGALHRLGLMTQAERQQRSQQQRSNMQTERRIRPFLERYFKIPKTLLATPDNDTIVCRCEEVTAGEVRQAVNEGHPSSNKVKFLTRCGMGACQGRQCHQAVAHIIANEKKCSLSKVDIFRGRSPVNPLSLSQLAHLKSTETL